MYLVGIHHATGDGGDTAPAIRSWWALPMIQVSRYPHTWVANTVYAVQLLYLENWNTVDSDFES